MEREKYLDSVSAEFMAVIYKHIPKKMIESHGYSEMSFRASLSKNNNSFSDSQYYYKAKRKFIHWTSIQRLMSIINYREIRLYNLHNSSDANEFRYAAQHLDLNDNKINHSKNYLYTFSFCKSSELDNNDLWVKYGDDYKGVALEFEIINDPNSWKNFMLSSVFYQLPTDFVDLEKDLKIFKKKFPSASTQIDLGKLIAFHKRPNFTNELEIRLSTYFPFKTGEEYDKYCNTEFRLEKERPRITDYFGLKLWVDNSSPFVRSDIPEFDKKQIVDNSYFIEKPQIKITNIYFGKNCGIKNQDFLPFQNKLEYILTIKLGYHIENLELNLFG